MGYSWDIHVFNVIGIIIIKLHRNCKYEIKIKEIIKFQII